MQERIIQFLRQSDTYVSGEEMSEQLNISRAAVWKYIDQLRQDGYDIAAVPHLGYKLQAAPDKLISHEIEFNLKTKVLGRRIVCLDSTTSTMDEAFRLAMDGAPEGTLVCAEFQTKGRGRLGRHWMSPKGKGLYFSLLLRPRFAPSHMAQLTLMTAVVLAQALEKFTNLEIRIKWPNDLLVKGRKLAGVLTELRAEMDQVKFVVIGIGLNVNASAGQLIPEAVSLKMAAGRHFDRIAILQEVLRRMEEWYGRFYEGWPLLLEQWKARSETLKRRVRVTDAAGLCEGVAVDLDKDGGLLIRQDSGIILKKMAGDVVHLR